MSQLLKLKQKVYTESSHAPCEVEQYIGGGGQGEVYRADLAGQKVALKWYFPHYLQQDPHLRERLEMAIRLGPPNDRFLWPIELVFSPRVPGFGYIMPLREPRFKSINDVMKRRVEPSFRALATAGFELANSFLELHAKGLCYRDISFSNVFLDPDTGRVCICDNDNVDIDGKGKGGILGTPRFMAPEIVRGEALPSIQTDLFSLAVLLFYMFMMHHPLEGKKELAIHSLDLPAMTKLYGEEPVFIFDPNDDSNRPVPPYHNNAIVFWPIYPHFLKKLFIRAFTDGIRDPQNGRVRESEWRAALITLRDSILYCANCGKENFYDIEVIRSSGELGTCWSCKKKIKLPFRIRIGNNIVMLNYDTQLFPHHIDPQKMYDFSTPIGKINPHPKDPNVWGLKNLSKEKWVATLPNGTVKDVEPGRSIPLIVGTKINFGKIEGEIR